LFGFTEDMKQSGEYPIKEYSAQQTTLEQIFNQFAKEKAMDKFNRSLRKNSTLRGRRGNQGGIRQSAVDLDRSQESH